MKNNIKIIFYYYLLCSSVFKNVVLQCLIILSEKLNHYNSFNHKFKLFDVSLRDGMQGLSTKEQQKYTTDAKFELYKKIINIHHVKDIEIGSLVNPNIMPIMNDTLKLHDKIIRYNELYHISDINSLCISR